MMQIGTRVQIAAELDVLPGWPGRKPGARGRVSACIDRIDGTVYLVRHDDGSPTARYLRDELTPIRERATEAAAPTPEQARLDELEARVERAEKRLDGQAISDDRLEKAHDRLKLETAELRAIFSDWQQRVVERLEEMAGDERYRAIADAMASELAGLDARLTQLESREPVSRHSAPCHPEPVHDDVTLDARPSELSALRGLRRAAEDQARADVDVLVAERDEALGRNARALETLRDVFDLRRDCTLITDAADDAAKQLRQLKAEIDDLTGGEAAAEKDPVQDLIRQLGQKGLSRATHGLEQLSRYSDLLLDELQRTLQVLADDGDGDGSCPAAMLAELCELLLRRGLSGPASEPEPDSSDGICFCDPGPCTCDAGSTSQSQRQS